MASRPTQDSIPCTGVKTVQGDFLLDKGVEFDEKPIFLFEKTALRLRSQRPLHMQGDAGHPG
jgi:hypothetical protein